MATYWEKPPLGDGGSELHMDYEDDITIILPDGEEIYVSGNGAVANSGGILLQEGNPKE